MDGIIKIETNDTLTNVGYTKKSTASSSKNDDDDLLNQALADETNKEYKPAYDKYRSLAMNGNAQAQWRIGMLLKDGLGIKQDRSKAFFWFGLAVNENVTSAKSIFGHWFIDEVSVIKRAEPNPEAHFELGNMYLDGHGVEKNDVEAIHCFTNAAEMGLAKANFALGNMHAHGYGVPQNFSEAMKHFKIAEQGGFLGATCAIGQLYALGFTDGTELANTDLRSLAISYFDKASEMGDCEGDYERGKLHMVGCGVEQNLDQAICHFVKANNGHSKNAKFELGKLFLYGYACVKYRQNGSQYIGPRFSNQHSLSAINSTSGEFYRPATGEDGKNFLLKKSTTFYIDYAYSLFESALPDKSNQAPSSSEGVLEAQPYMYIMYQFDWCTAADLPFSYGDMESPSWLLQKYPEIPAVVEQRLDSDNAKHAKRALKDMEGYPEAIKYYQNAAEKKPPLEIKERVRYSNKFGADYSEEVRYYNDAVINNKNDPTAWFQLGLLYLHGRGVERNLEKGKQCFIEASRLGKPDAIELLEQLKDKKSWSDEFFAEAISKWENVFTPTKTQENASLIDDDNL